MGQDHKTLVIRAVLNKQPALQRITATKCPAGMSCRRFTHSHSNAA